MSTVRPALLALEDAGGGSPVGILLIISLIAATVAVRALTALAQAASALASAALATFAALGRVAGTAFVGGIVVFALLFGGCQSSAADPVHGRTDQHTSVGGAVTVDAVLVSPGRAGTGRSAGR
jgi:hypothetical protein